MALDKKRKRGAKTTIFVFDILDLRTGNYCIIGLHLHCFPGSIWPQFVELAAVHDRFAMVVQDH